MAERPDEVRGRDPQAGRPTPSEREELEERARSGDEVAAARAEVEQARAEMTETVDALQEKLEPRNLQEQIKARVRDAARGAGYQLLGAMRRNPLPTAVAGIALGLLLARRLRR